VVEHGEVGIDVEGEAVHRPAPSDPDADRRDLAPVDPHAGEAVEPAGPRQPEVGQRVDDDLLDGMHVGRHRPRPHGHVDDRVPDQLAGPVVGDVAAPVGLDQVGPDRRRRHEHVGQVGPHAERVDVRVLEQQQPLVVPGPMEGALELGRLPVRNSTEPAGAH
jgi:hypothetical protein